MYVTVCGRLNHLTDDVPNEGGVAGKGIKGNALCRLNAVQISRKVVIQMAGMIFQTRSKIYKMRLLNMHALVYNGDMVQHEIFSERSYHIDTY